MSNTLPIIEIFGPTIQGEGTMSGTITHFLRTGGCPLRCTWCDSMYAVDPAEVKRNATKMTTAEILQAVQALPYAPWITFTGGDPCMWELLGDVIPALNGPQYNMRVAIETQGTLFPSWLENADLVTFSPKPPSSGNVVDIAGINKYLQERRPDHQRICIKIVIASADDLSYAFDVVNSIPMQLVEGYYFNACSSVIPIGHSILAPATRVLDTVDLYRAIADHVLSVSEQTNHKIHVGCQQHVLLWPESEKGL